MATTVVAEEEVVQEGVVVVVVIEEEMILEAGDLQIQHLLIIPSILMQSDLETSITIKTEPTIISI